MNQAIPIPPEAKGQRADKFVSTTLPEYSRSFWQKQFAAGAISQNGQILKSSDSLQEGDLQIATEEHILKPLDIPIIYEDDDVLVLNKPAGLLTHAKGVIAEESTLADFVRPRASDAPESNRPGIVHRLDRDTSGVIITAKNPEAKRWLQKQFAERKVKKTYTAIVKGQVTPPEALLRLPLERNPKMPQQFRVGAGGKPAETAYRVVRQLPAYGVVELKPHTGRTHQLRVHMAYLKHPIVGDRIYGTPAEGLLLHASSLELTLPSRQRRVFTVPLPPSFATFIEAHQ